MFRKILLGATLVVIGLIIGCIPKTKTTQEQPRIIMEAEVLR